MTSAFVEPDAVVVRRADPTRSLLQGMPYTNAANTNVALTWARFKVPQMGSACIGPDHTEQERFES